LKDVVAPLSVFQSPTISLSALELSPPQAHRDRHIKSAKRRAIVFFIVLPLFIKVRNRNFAIELCYKTTLPRIDEKFKEARTAMSFFTSRVL